jgi:hypothetical protein
MIVSISYKDITIGVYGYSIRQIKLGSNTFAINKSSNKGINFYFNNIGNYSYKITSTNSCYSITSGFASVEVPSILPLLGLKFNALGRLGLIEYFTVALSGLIPLAY